MEPYLVPLEDMGGDGMDPARYARLRIRAEKGDRAAEAEMRRMEAIRYKAVNPDDLLTDSKKKEK